MENQVEFGEGFMYRGKNGQGWCRGIEINARSGGLAPTRALRLNPLCSTGYTSSCYIEMPVEKVRDIVNLMLSMIGETAPPVEKVPSSVELLMADNLWNEHPEYLRADWMLLIRDGDVQSGYWDWVKGSIEEDEEDLNIAKIRLQEFDQRRKDSENKEEAS